MTTKLANLALATAGVAQAQTLSTEDLAPHTLERRAVEAAICGMPIVSVDWRRNGARLFGTFSDAWQVPIVEVGPIGDDAGKRSGLTNPCRRKLHTFSIDCDAWHNALQRVAARFNDRQCPGVVPSQVLKAR